MDNSWNAARPLSIASLGLAAAGRIIWRVRKLAAILLTLVFAAWLSCLALKAIPRHLATASIGFQHLRHNYYLNHQQQKQEQPPSSRYNASKLALLIENRPSPVLAPLMMHFISVVPPDWRFRFMGSRQSLAKMNSSAAIREQVALGKLDLTLIPKNMTTGSQEDISTFLTNLWLYETLLAPAEWLLVFQTDSMLCANSRHTLDDYLEYDWVGAPWDPNGPYGGNGGLSLRRVSAMVEVLRNQVRQGGAEPEDVWMSERLGHRVGGRLANGTVSGTFSGEIWSGLVNDIRNPDYVDHEDEPWRRGFYEPMGYHIGGSGIMHSAIWGQPDLRKHVWDYCPEVKMMLKMEAKTFMSDKCTVVWVKRDLETEVIDGVEYPRLPDDFAPW